MLKRLKERFPFKAAHIDAGLMLEKAVQSLEPYALGGLAAARMSPPP